MQHEGEAGAPITDAEREPYLRAALLAFESGSLDSDEYTRRVHEIDRAGSVAEMARVLARPASRGAEAGNSHGAAGEERPVAGREAAAGNEEAASRPALDAVDLARMMAPAPGVRSRTKSSRYAVLIMVALLIVVLIGIGLWLASRVHNANSNSGGAIVGPGIALHTSPPVVPPSALSSRR